MIWRQRLRSRWRGKLFAHIVLAAFMTHLWCFLRARQPRFLFIFIIRKRKALSVKIHFCVPQKNESQTAFRNDVKIVILGWIMNRSFKSLLSMCRRYISRAFLCHVVFILADPLESSLKVPQPFARSAFIALGRRAADRLEERSSFLNILNHLLSVFWQRTFRLPPTLRHDGRNSKRYWERRSVLYSKYARGSAAGRLPLFK